MKKILVVGSGGLVGNHFLELFYEKYKIVGVDKNMDIKKLADHHEFFDVLVFLAQSKEYINKVFTEDLMNTNVNLLRYYLHQFSGKCPKVILFSTGSVYQDSKEEINENSALVNENITSYAASKIMSEILAKSFASFYQSIAIVRPFTIYGAGQKSTMLFSRLLNNLKTKTPIEIGQQGGIEFNPVHAEDTARFIDYLINRNFQGIEYFNHFGTEILTLKDLVDKISNILALSPVISERDWPFKKMVATSTNHDFHPTVSLENGLSKMISGVKTNVEERNFS